MEAADTAKYRESQNQWLIEVLSRRHELSIQMAKLDDEISMVRKVLRSYDNHDSQSSVKDSQPRYHKTDR
jgi:hypothetical protein